MIALASGATAIVLLVLALELATPRLWRSVLASRSREWAPGEGYDPGRELRAEQRARVLLRSCVNREEWEMYRDLGFVRIWGGLGETPRSAPGAPQPASAAPYAYLIYPHRPIVAYLPQTGALLGEYCIAFPDRTRPYGNSRLPDADDVLAKWMTLAADERGMIASANMHLPGRQLSLELIRGDLSRLARWERARIARPRDGAGSVPAL